MPRALGSWWLATAFHTELSSNQRRHESANDCASARFYADEPNGAFVGSVSGGNQSGGRDAS